MTSTDCKDRDPENLGICCIPIQEKIQTVEKESSDVVDSGQQNPDQ